MHKGSYSFLIECSLSFVYTSAYFDGNFLFFGLSRFLQACALRHVDLTPAPCRLLGHTRPSQRLSSLIAYTFIQATSFMDILAGSQPASLFLASRTHQNGEGRCFSNSGARRRWHVTCLPSLMQQYLYLIFFHIIQ
jgi:hypothetical protein